MLDKSSTTTSGTRYECPVGVKTSNSLWMTTWLKVDPYSIFNDFQELFVGYLL